MAMTQFLSGVLNTPPSLSNSSVSTIWNLVGGASTSDYAQLPLNEARLHHSLEECNYGSCAVIAISSAFNIPQLPFKAILKALKIKEEEEGLTFNECKKLINFLCSVYEYQCKYSSNYEKVTYSQMIALLNKGNYIVMFDIHLSYAKNGEIYDTYLYNKCEDYKKIKPTGWWKIN